MCVGDACCLSPERVACRRCRSGRGRVAVEVEVGWGYEEPEGALSAALLSSLECDTHASAITGLRCGRGRGGGDEKSRSLIIVEIE